MRIPWLALAVLAVPLGVLPAAWTDSVAQAKNFFFIFLIGLGTILLFLESWWLRVFVAWVLASFIWSGARMWALAGFLGVLGWAVCWQAASRLTEETWDRIRLAITGAALFQVAWMVLQALGYDPLFSPVSYWGTPLSGSVPAIGWFSNPSDTALFLGLSLPAILPVSRWVAVLVVVAIGFGLGSVAGLLAIGITLGWVLWRWAGQPIRVRAGILLIAVSAIGAILWRFEFQGLGTRLTIWRHAWDLAWMAPVIGWGPNAIGYRLQVHIPDRLERWEFLFSEPLQGAVELGFVGLALGVGFLAYLGWRALSASRVVDFGELVPACLILLGVSLFSIPLRIGPTALLSALYLGRLEGIIREEE